MRVLVTGGAGYLGSVVVPRLLEHQHDIIVLDSLLYRQQPDHHTFRLVRADIRDTNLLDELITDVDAIVHLGAIVGDPACDIDIAEAIAVNFTAAVDIATRAARRGLRFIFASTCSVYGANSSGELAETAPVFPLSVYALSKLAAEQRILAECPNGLVFRFGTLFGYSPRMRFDLVINRFIAQAIQDSKITVLGGAQLRPFVHVRDVADLLACALPSDAGSVFNMGGFNISIADLAAEIQHHVPCEVITHPYIQDPRNYAVDSSKTLAAFGVGCTRGIPVAISEIREAYACGQVTDYRQPAYSNQLFLTQEKTRA